MKLDLKNGHLLPARAALDDIMSIENRLTWGINKQLSAIYGAFVAGQRLLNGHVRRVLVQNGAPDGQSVRLEDVPAENRARANAELEALAYEDAPEIDIEPIPDAAFPDSLICSPQSRLLLIELGVITTAPAEAEEIPPAITERMAPGRNGKAKGRRPAKAT